MLSFYRLLIKLAALPGNVSVLYNSWLLVVAAKSEINHNVSKCMVVSSDISQNIQGNNTKT